MNAKSVMQRAKPVMIKLCVQVVKMDIIIIKEIVKTSAPFPISLILKLKHVYYAQRDCIGYNQIVILDIALQFATKDCCL